MAKLTLEKSVAFAGCELPITLGGTTLEAMETDAITAVMPLMGQSMAVAKAVKTALGVSLPKVGKVVQAKTGELVWFGPGQWLVFTKDPAPLTSALQDLAAVVDQSGGWQVLKLSGLDATQVMARLCPLDFDTLAVGSIARSEFAHVSAVILPKEDGLLIMVPRSFAMSVYENLLDAIKSLAAQKLLG